MDNDNEPVERPDDQISSIVKEYYVYELFDAETGEVFYVGEGIRDRAYQHIKEAERIRKKLSVDPGIDGSLASEKIDKIQNLMSANENRVGVRIIGRFETKEEAQSVETVLINWVYGVSTLTNISRGRGAKYVRPKAQPREELSGIDLDKKVIVFGGNKREKTGYLENMINNHEVYGHFAMAENIVEYLNERFPSLEIDEPNFWESGRYVAIFITLVPGEVRMMIQLTDSGKSQHVYNLKPMSESKKDVDKFVRYMERKYPDIPLKRNGQYAKLPAWRGLKVANVDHETIAAEVERAKNFFASSDL